MKKDSPGLFPGEKVVFEKGSSADTVTDEELNSRYIKGEVRIVTESARYSLAGILKMLQETVVPEGETKPELRYKLDPEYQRRHRWDDVRKSRLIESFLMNVPVPPVFLYERDLARFEVMDGRQRLTALSEFYDNKLRLQGLEHWPELDGRTYAQLPSKVRDGIDRRYISSIILLKETAATQEDAAKLKKIVFERLNSGGVRLSPQETRNAVYDGPLNQLCLDLSKNASFRAAWGIPADERMETDEDPDEEEGSGDGTSSGRRMYGKMDDVELVLRFFAYRQIESFSGGLNKINAMLDRFLVRGNKFPAELLSSYRALFNGTISLLTDLFGSRAFSRIGPDGRPHGRPNKIIYDPIMYVASGFVDEPGRGRLIAQRDALHQLLGAMYAKHPDLFAGRSTNKADVTDRNARMRAVFDAAVATPKG